MQDKDLQALASQLREELAKLPAEAQGLERLQELASQLDAYAAGDPGEQAGENLSAGISEALTEFEVEHPKATATLQRIVSALSSMGI